MFKVRKTKKKSSASGARVSSAAHTTEEADDLRSVQDDGHDSDSQTLAGEGHVSTPANTELDGDAEPDVYTPPQRPRLYVAAARRSRTSPSVHPGASSPVSGSDLRDGNGASVPFNTRSISIS